MHSYLNPPPIVFGPDVDRSSLRDLNTDLFPKDEYDWSFRTVESSE